MVKGDTICQSRLMEKRLAQWVASATNRPQEAPRAFATAVVDVDAD